MGLLKFKLGYLKLVLKGKLCRIFHKKKKKYRQKECLLWSLEVCGGVSVFVCTCVVILKFLLHPLASRCAPGNNDTQRR